MSEMPAEDLSKLMLLARELREDHPANLDYLKFSTDNAKDISIKLRAAGKYWRDNKYLEIHWIHKLSGASHT
jgi:hypothetical protein